MIYLQFWSCVHTPVPVRASKRPDPPCSRNRKRLLERCSGSRWSHVRDDDLSGYWRIATVKVGVTVKVARSSQPASPSLPNKPTEGLEEFPSMTPCPAALKG